MSDFRPPHEDWYDLADALDQQSAFSTLFFKNKDMSPKQKQEMLKTFALSLHSEVTGIADAVSYKEHRLQDVPADTQKILYKSVDAYRYLLAILNLWDVDAETFARALSQKDDYLHYRHRLSMKKWDGQPIVLFDMDDILANFRESFCDFCTKKTGTFFDPFSKEYYNVSEFKTLGLNSEGFFRDFVSGHGLLSLKINKNFESVFRRLHAAGYWIQIITARPEKNLTALYDTFSWLERHQLYADGVTFNPEKFVWLTDQEFYSAGRYIAIDDSAKHAAEYAKHGVRTVVPMRSYNGEVKNQFNVHYVTDETSVFDLVTRLLPRVK